MSPAYGVLPSGQGLRYQQMQVGNDGADATLADALSQSRQFGLTADEAVQQLRKVAVVVAGWNKHFTATGVTPVDIATLALQIDRPFLAEQRRAWAR